MLLLLCPALLRRFGITANVLLLQLLSAVQLLLLLLGCVCARAHAVLPVLSVPVEGGPNTTIRNTEQTRARNTTSGGEGGLRGSFALV